MLEGMQCCGTCPVRHQAVCGALDHRQLQRLAAVARRRKIAAGQILFMELEPIGSYANVVSGVIKLTKSLPDGRQLTVALLFAPDFLGRAYSSDNPYRAEAATDVEICVFPKTAFEKLVADHPGLRERLFRRSLDELDAARRWMVLLGKKTATEKLASFLYFLAEGSIQRCGKPASGQQAPVIELPLSRVEIADYLGLTTETVCRQFHRLRVKKVIEMDNKRLVVIRDMTQLVIAAGFIGAGPIVRPAM